MAVSMNFVLLSAVIKVSDGSIYCILLVLKMFNQVEPPHGRKWGCITSYDSSATSDLSDNL